MTDNQIVELYFRRSERDVFLCRHWYMDSIRDIASDFGFTQGADSARNANLQLACDAINGGMVVPGETFSFNDTVGNISARYIFSENHTVSFLELNWSGDTPPCSLLN